MPSSPICCDASLVARLLLGGPGSEQATALWKQWMIEQRRRIAPDLLGYELTNVFFQYSRAGQITIAEAKEFLTEFHKLGIEPIYTPDSHIEALDFTDELGAKATYDAHYLACAHHLNAELWTLDHRLYRLAANKYTWVRWAGESLEAAG